MGQKLEVSGRVRTLRWADGASGELTGALEGLYEAFRVGEDEGDRASFVLELAGGTLAVEVDVREAGDAGLPPRPDEHPFAAGRGSGVPARALPSCSSRTAGPAPRGAVAVTIRPEACSGIFAGAEGALRFSVPSVPGSGSLVIHTGSGTLWTDYVEACAPGTLTADLWIDGLRSTGQWRGAEGKLRFVLELHRPNLALGWYEGTCLLTPRAADRYQTFVPC